MTDPAALPALIPLATPPDADRPAHYRLSNDTWEIICKEYREGATAPFLAHKWRVSGHAIRRRVTQHGSTRRDWGDSQAIGQALAREAAFETVRRKVPGMDDEWEAAQRAALERRGGEGAGAPA